MSRSAPARSPLRLCATRWPPSATRASAGCSRSRSPGAPPAGDAALVGAASAGLSLANFSLPIALSGPRERSFYIATLAASGGLVTGLASAGGGAMVKLLPALTVVASRPLVASQVLFLCGGAARFCAAFLALRIADQPLDRVVSLPEPPRRAKLAA